MDLGGRYIVACRLGTEMTASLVSDTVKDAFASEKEKIADGLTLHSDQDCQYTSEEYFALTEEYHFSASMSSKDCPYGNAVSTGCILRRLKSSQPHIIHKLLSCH